MVRFELGDKLGAIDDFTEAIQLNPNDAEVYRKRGGIYLILGKKKSAREDFQQAARITSGSRGNGFSSQTPPSSVFQPKQ
jgi:Flp pilus assembly protein TadD